MRPREILPPVRTFCFDHFTVKNQTYTRTKSTAIRRQTIYTESLIRKRALLEEQYSLHVFCLTCTHLY